MKKPNSNTEVSEANTAFAQTIVAMCQAHTSPSHYGELANTLENLLSNPNSQIELNALEAHASLSSHLDSPQSKANADAPLSLYRLKNFSQTENPQDQSAFEEFKMRIFDQDICKIETWLNNVQSNLEEPSLQIFRSECAGDNSLEFYAIRHEQGHFFIYPATTRLKAGIENILASAFNISNSEMIVVREILMNKSITQIADDMGKSVETIRSQFKAAASKIGLSRQQDVANFVRSISDFGDDAGYSKASHARSAEFKLADGRIIFYDKIGDPNGRPYFFAHDFANGRHWPESTIEEFTKRGMCVYSISRAGFGGTSSIDKVGLDLLDQHVADFHEIIVAENLETFSFLAFGTGFALAYRFALTHPDQVEKIIGVDIYPPILSLKDAMNFPSGFYRSSIMTSLLVPKTHVAFSKIAAKRAKVVEHPAELEKMLSLKLFEPEGAVELFDTVVKKNLQDLALSQFEGSWRDCTFVTQDWAQLGQNLNSRPQTFVIQHANFPSLKIDAVRKFSDQIDMNFEETSKPFRFLFGETDVIFKQIDQLA